MDDKQCERYINAVDDKLESHDKRLDAHSARLDELEKYRYMIDERINNLIAKMDDLMGTMKLVTKSIITGAVGLFIYIIQQFLLNR